MADGLPVTPGSGATVAADTVGSATPPATGDRIQYVKLDLGAGGASAPVVGSNSGVPVDAAGTKVTAATIPTGGVGFLGWLSAIWYQLTQQLAVSSGGFTALSNASFTRPTNTTQYAIGQVIADSVSAATVRTFTNCARVNGSTGTVFGAMVTDSAKQSVSLQANLWLFNVSPTVQNDGAAFAPSGTDLANLVAVIPLSIFESASANGVLIANELNRPFKCAAGSTTLYGVLVAVNPYTPVSAEVFNTTLLIGED